MESPKPGTQQVSVKAKVDAPLRGSERGLLVLGMLFLLLFLGSLSTIAMVKPTLPGYAGTGIGLLGLVGLLIQWWRMGERAYQHDAASTNLIVSEQSVQIVTPLLTLQEKVTLVREIIHNRKRLPAPHGKSDNLQVYSDDERRRIVEEIQEGLKQHDAQILRNLQKIMPVLSQEASVESVPSPLEQSPLDNPQGGRQADSLDSSS